MRAQAGGPWLLDTFIHFFFRDYLQIVQDVNFFGRIFENQPG